MLPLFSLLKRKEWPIYTPRLTKGMDGFPSMGSMGSVFYSHACAASCIASQNHSSNKLLTQDTDRKRFRIVPETIYCLLYIYNF